MSQNERLTQNYSTWGDKLLQHTDVLNSIQNERKFKPGTIQLAPTEACDSACDFCSVKARPVKNYMPFKTLKQCLTDFRTLGAKSVEITGGGNPLLYRDRVSGQNINDAIEVAAGLGLDIGIITNSHNLKVLDPKLFPSINWIRVSLIQLDEGIRPEEYNFNGFPETKLGFSYIIYETGGVQDEFSRTRKAYRGTDQQSIENIARLVELHPDVKFVRIAGDCLIKGNNQAVKEKYKDIIDAVDKYGKFFIKDIGLNDSPFNDGCYVGMIRPYIASSPEGDGYNVYTCTSHVLEDRTYKRAYALCRVEDILPTWHAMNERFAKEGYPYEVNGNCGRNWADTCNFCYYYNNNEILHGVATNQINLAEIPTREMPDKNFP